MASDAQGYRRSGDAADVRLRQPGHEKPHPASRLSSTFELNKARIPVTDGAASGFLRIALPGFRRGRNCVHRVAPELHRFRGRFCADHWRRRCGPRSGRRLSRGGDGA